LVKGKAWKVWLKVGKGWKALGKKERNLRNLRLNHFFPKGGLAFKVPPFLNYLLLG